MQPSSLSEGGTQQQVVGEQGRLASKLEEDSFEDPLVSFSTCLFEIQKCKYTCLTFVFPVRQLEMVGFMRGYLL